MNKLKVVATDTRRSAEAPRNPRASRQQKSKARFERRWHLSPEYFDPKRNARQRQRMEDLWQLIVAAVSLKGSKVADLGCGTGWLTERLLEAGAEVYAVDIAANALKHLKASPNLTIVQAPLPHSDLPDDCFDLVICADTIADLAPQDYRLMMAEIYRITHPKGLAICSTAVDVFSRNALSRFEDLIGTEMEATECLYRYHSWYIKILKGLRKLRGMGWGEKWNQSDRALHTLERLNRTLRGRKGVSHATILAKRRNAFTTSW